MIAPRAREVISAYIASAGREAGAPPLSGARGAAAPDPAEGPGPKASEKPPTESGKRDGEICLYAKGWDDASPIPPQLKPVGRVLISGIKVTNLGCCLDYTETGFPK